jgi:hypothetical protein
MVRAVLVPVVMVHVPVVMVHVSVVMVSVVRVRVVVAAVVVAAHVRGARCNVDPRAVRVRRALTDATAANAEPVLVAGHHRRCRGRALVRDLAARRE